MGEVSKGYKNSSLRRESIIRHCIFSTKRFTIPSVNLLYLILYHHPPVLCNFDIELAILPVPFIPPLNSSSSNKPLWQQGVTANMACDQL